MVYSIKMTSPTDVWINGIYKGQLNSYFPSGKPYYGQQGTISEVVNIGTHTIQTRCNGYTITTSANVTKDGTFRLVLK
ncbi:hypothetical protein FACS189415_6280 [Bacteroidia bacterium]|nr:hypothetical protein FACS189426_07750 [Bacteroidia bacterium]GHU83617.1 hypothetical protein FACS189415_6280 [Bacteroidia bacterium]